MAHLLGWHQWKSVRHSGATPGGHVVLDAGHGIIFHDGIQDFPKDLLSSALHEVAHHAEIHHDDAFSSYDASSCAEIPEEEEDEDEEEPNGGQTCTEEPYTYIALVPVWTQIEAGSCIGISSVGVPFPQGEFEESESEEDDDEHCTLPVWGWVVEAQERTGTRVVCVLNN